MENLKQNKTPKVAYFCMEYGLSKNLPIYAGGLGILAGDYLKAAKDLNVPIIGVGILWRQDYTTQLIGQDNYPHDHYQNYDFSGIIQDTNVTVKCRVRGTEVTCKVWKVDMFGNNPLYLLDAGFPGSEHSWITTRLYGGSEQDRIAQEIILGVGGIRALRALNLDVDVYHFNEGHAVFAGLELIREKMAAGMSFREAWEATRKEVVFTTHTPVEAGNEVHNCGLLMHMEANNGLSYEQLTELGGNPFNMTIAALRLACKANAVSQAHEKTAQKMWQHIDNAAQIIAITNGVHLSTWQNQEIKQAYEQNKDLASVHQKLKKKLLDYIAKQNKVELKPDILTIGFARRAAAYKRGGLIFKRLDLLEPLFKTNKLQLIYSGKAHPNDHQGKNIIQQIVEISKRYPNHVVFLEDYDMDIARLMVQGCDVWLNNPLRPMEASGTSGMKAALNGVLNVSVLDGWVGEAITHQESGWILDEIIGEPLENWDQDEYDLQAFYHVLFKEIIPIYYEDKTRWIRMMKASIKMGEELLSSERMIREYYSELYNYAFELKKENLLVKGLS
ncbi:MAG TPA: alpha-glucan family phosphorylase [Clostridia bacterium]|nr:alpha-glucan family phosphorylase [Clostridia bacterium]